MGAQGARSARGALVLLCFCAVVLLCSRELVQLGSWVVVVAERGIAKEDSVPEVSPTLQRAVLRAATTAASHTPEVMCLAKEIATMVGCKLCIRCSRFGHRRSNDQSNQVAVDS